MSTFSSLPLIDSLKATLREQGLAQTTEVQAKALPALLDGRSSVVVSQTGSGKTLVYLLPVLQILKKLEEDTVPVRNPGSPRALVLVPSRELGEQVAKVFKTFTHNTRLRVRSVLGGRKRAQERETVGRLLEVLVATPGRLEQLLDQGSVRLDDLRLLVFDEADQLLDRGFVPVALKALASAPGEVQLIMASATMPQGLRKAVRELFDSEPLWVETKRAQRTVSTLKTRNVRITKEGRMVALRQELDRDRKSLTILFVNSRKQADRVCEWLDTEGHGYAIYRGELEAKERRDNLQRFREGKVRLLVATDLAGRGLDIAGVLRVINVNLPRDPELYLHRVGRTARAGRPGLVVNLVGEKDAEIFKTIQAL